MLLGMPGERTALLSTLLSLPDGERAAVERDLAELSERAALGGLAADVAHDVANPLFGVIGLVELLLEDATPGTDDAERLRLVRDAALEMKATLNALLELARPAADETARADLGESTRTAVALVRHGVGKGLAVEARYPAEATFVACTPRTVLQIVLQLLPDTRDVTSVSIEVAAGRVRIEPAANDELRVAIALRLACDNGGTVEREGAAVILTLP